MVVGYIACFALVAGILFNVGRRTADTQRSVENYHRAMATLRQISKRVRRQMYVAASSSKGPGTDGPLMKDLRSAPPGDRWPDPRT